LLCGREVAWGAKSYSEARLGLAFQRWNLCDSLDTCGFADSFVIDDDDRRTSTHSVQIADEASRNSALDDL
jgi:hypothetical protein